MDDNTSMCLICGILLIVPVLAFFLFREIINKSHTFLDTKNIEPSKPSQSTAITPNNVIFEARGVSGQVQLLENKIIIKRQGFLGFTTFGGRGDKEIYINRITSIQFKKPGMLNGYIQFSYPGSIESKQGILDATQDENTIMFSQASLPDFEKIKVMIEERMTNPGFPISTSSTNLNDLEKLAGLKDKGIITEEEFQAKKKQILGI